MNNLDDVVMFCDPHPGFAGASIPIPEPVRVVANVLDKKQLTIKRAVDMIKKVIIEGEVYVAFKEKCIMLIVKTPSKEIKNSWRVIRWR